MRNRIYLLILLAAGVLAGCGIFEDHDFVDLEEDVEVRDGVDLPTMRPTEDMASVPDLDESDLPDMEQEDLDTCEDCPAAIEVDPERVELAVGEDFQASVRVLNAQGGEIPEPEVFWQSDSSEIATVDEFGWITGISEGNTSVTVRSGMLEASVEVIVEMGELGEIELVPAGPVSLVVGESIDFTVDVASGAACVFDYAVTDPQVASVSATGQVTGISAGMTTLTVTCGGPITAEAEINVTEFDSSLMKSGRLLAWFRASDGITTSGTNVVGWQGISAHERNLDSSIKDPPELVAAAINGHPAVRFSQTQTLSTVGSYSTREEVVVDRFTIFFVSKNDDASHRGQLLSTCTTGGSNQQIRYNGSDDSFFVYGHFTDHRSSIMTSSPTTSYQVLTFKRSSSELGIFQDGQPSASKTTSGSGSFHFSQIGARCTNEYLQGEIAEFLIFGEALTSAEQALVEAYLKARYNL